MGRHSCCVKAKLRKGLWSPEEDEKLINYVTRFGVGCWSSVPKLAGLERCGKSCRLRWINYLRPDLKRGMFTQEEEDVIINLHKVLGNRWAQIAAKLPGRTDNEIKNFWNSSLKKKLMKQGIDPKTHKPLSEVDESREQKENSTEKAASFLPQPYATMPMASSTTLASIKTEPQLLVGNSSFMNQGNSIIEPALDPSTEFHEGFDPIIGYKLSVLAGQYHDQVLRPAELVADHEAVNMFGFSLPSLANLEKDDNIPRTEFSDNLTQRVSSMLFNEANESSSNSSNINGAVSLSRDIAGYKLDSLIQYNHDQLNEVEDEKEQKPNPWPVEQSHDQSLYDFSYIFQQM